MYCDNIYTSAHELYPSGIQCFKIIIDENNLSEAVKNEYRYNTSNTIYGMISIENEAQMLYFQNYNGVFKDKVWIKNFLFVGDCDISKFLNDLKFMFLLNLSQLKCRSIGREKERYIDLKKLSNICEGSRNDSSITTDIITNYISTYLNPDVIEEMKDCGQFSGYNISEYTRHFDVINNNRISGIFSDTIPDSFWDDVPIESEFKWHPSETTEETDNGTKEIDEEKTIDEPDCSICCTNKMSMVCVPCGHRYCDVCIEYSDKCSICRKTITNKIKYY